MSAVSVLAPADLERAFEEHRRELVGYCYRMLASPFEAEDAVQETMLRAWKSLDRFEGRAALRSWLYRIATNVCFDLLNGKERRARPMDLGPSREPIAENLNTLPEVTWIEPAPRAHHRLLHRVLGVEGRAQHAIAVARQLPPVSLELPFELG